MLSEAFSSEMLHPLHHSISIFNSTFASSASVAPLNFQTSVGYVKPNPLTIDLSLAVGSNDYFRSLAYFDRYVM